jgi:hypothetical protein
VFKLGTNRMTGLLYFMFSLVLKLGANWIPGLVCLCYISVTIWMPTRSLHLTSASSIPCHMLPMVFFECNFFLELPKFWHGISASFSLQFDDVQMMLLFCELLVS